MSVVHLSLAGPRYDVTWPCSHCPAWRSPTIKPSAVKVIYAHFLLVTLRTLKIEVKKRISRVEISVGQIPGSRT